MNHNGNGKRQIDTTGKTLSQIRAEAGMLGAIALGQKFETDEDYCRHMARIGAKGAKTTHERYSIAPYETSDYVMVERSTGSWVANLLERSLKCG